MATTDGIDFDTSAVRKLSEDLGKASGKVFAAVEAVTAKAALNVKTNMARDAETFAGSHAPHFHRSISYDRKLTIGSVAYEIGPDKSRRGAQGALGNILYFGTSKNSPVLNLTAGLEEEAPNFIAHLAIAAAGVLE